MSDNLQIKIKRFDKTIPLPEYKTAGAACFDLAARENITIKPGTIGYIPLNVAIEVPTGYWSLLAARSSTHKMGLLPANGIGIIDADYCGDNDEYLFAALNYTAEPVVIERGTRVAQMLILPTMALTLTEVDHLTGSDRGAFGTTGHK